MPQKWGYAQYHFGGPANSGSPVALRPFLAEDLPFSTAICCEYGRISAVCQSEIVNRQGANQPATAPPLVHHANVA